MIRRLSERRRIERKVTRRSTERMEKVERNMKNGREVRWRTETEKLRRRSVREK